MKKVISLLGIMILAIIICVVFWKLDKRDNPVEEVDKSSVSYNGWLKVDGADLVNEKGEKVQLRGLSSHGIQWFYDLVTYDNLKTLKEDWNSNVFRIAMYTNPDESGYVSNPDEMKEKVYSIVDMAIDLDMYVIVDWHVLNDKNPQVYQEDAKLFFSELSSKYKDTPNVIYEICNEPNGNEAKWNENIKPYAEYVIPTIRENSPKSVVIVGTPRWSSNIYEVMGNTLEYSNVLYACHFYAGSNGEGLRHDIDLLREKNIAIFVSECGITDATGSGEIYTDKFEEWINFLNERNISWVFWSLSNKDEESSVLNTEYYAGAEGSINDYLSDTGVIVKELLTK